eukprot:1177950-Prorocentrum_minimum.AAC.2
MAAEPRGLELRGTKGGNTSQSTRPQERAGSVPPRQRGIRRKGLNPPRQRGIRRVLGPCYYDRKGRILLANVAYNDHPQANEPGGEQARQNKANWTGQTETKRICVLYERDKIGVV